MINRCFLTGNLTKDGELRQTQSGSYVLSFGIAVNDRRKNPATGEWQEFPNYFDATMFGNRAQAVSPYLVKGTKVTIEGPLRWSQWEDKNTGQKRSKVEVIVDEIEFMSRGQGQQAQQYAPAAPQTAPAAPQAPQAYSAPPQPQAAPQPAQGYPAGQGTYQPAMPQPPADPTIEILDSDIPFDGGRNLD